MTFIKIHKKDKPIKTIDVTPVEEITNNLEKLLRKRENFLDRKHIQYELEIMGKAREMDKEQLRYLTTNLLGLLFKYADLYQHTIDNPEKHLKQMEQYREVKKMFGKTLKKPLQLYS